MFKKTQTYFLFHKIFQLPTNYLEEVLRKLGKEIKKNEYVTFRISNVFLC